MNSIYDRSELIEELNNITTVVNIEKVRDIELPNYANIGDAGADVRSAIDIDINPGETVLIPLGFKLSIPIGYQIEIRPRSGISFKTPLRIPNAPGTIDSGYKGELCVIMSNTSIRNDGIYSLEEKNNHNGVYHISKGDRIAQIILTKYNKIKFNEVKHIDSIDNRGGGFGSTGI